MNYTYNLKDLAEMIKHWVNTPPNAYLGQNYGFNIQSILLSPLSESKADFILKQLREHIPPLQKLNSSQLAIYKETVNNDTEKYFIVLNGELEIPLEISRET